MEDGRETMRITTLAQLEACERQYLIARGWHRRQVNRGEVWVAPQELRPWVVDVDSQDIAVKLQKHADERMRKGRKP